MTRLVLVRHGEAAAGWGDDLDPGLSADGRRQADALADVLAAEPPSPIVASPLRRTMETAAVLAARWGVEVRAEPAVGEVPSPTEDLAGRAAWLSGFLAGGWADASDDLWQWRRRLVATLVALTTDTVVVTHFVAINAAVAEAGGGSEVVSFHPDYCSRTVLDVESGRLHLVQLGAERTTRVR